jgi:hypothetical protein
LTESQQEQERRRKEETNIEKKQGRKEGNQHCQRERSKEVLERKKY